jgi:Fic-DOC domain mobile mystery protein B
LNEAEQENILAGAAWARSRRRTAVEILTDKFALALHKRMFGKVWKWAGAYRLTERNLGVIPYKIRVDVAALFDDVRYWIDHATYGPDEIAVRLHHRLVAIHPFPNGNGRHSRIMADLLVERLGNRTFSWGGGSLADIGALRRKYIDALKEADNHNMHPLLAFARS